MKNKKIGIILFLLLIILLKKNFLLYDKILAYYQNFLVFLADKKSVNQYQSFFDKQTPIDYQLAQYLKNHLNQNENIFVWGNNAQLYALVGKIPQGRYVVKYHATANKKILKETERSFIKNKPKYIVETLRGSNFPFDLSEYAQKLIIGKSVIYERIF